MAAETPPFFAPTARPGAFTDPVSNITVLPSREVEHNLVGLLTGDPLPIRFAPSFIHEVTHHRCFFSPVGNTVALLNLRARRRALASVLEHEDPDPLGERALDIFDDFIRYETAMEALRPLSE